MTQNIYDEADFFAGYSQLPRSVHGLDGAPEWPVLRAMPPPMRGQRVLDLGCGFGWFSRWARENGAAGVLGVDVSSNVLEQARAETNDAGITYEQADLERFAPACRAFDLAYSSLAFHYLADLEGLLARVHAALRPGGILVCSVEHPLMTVAPRRGWLGEAEGQAVWPVSGYLDEGSRATDWLAKGVLKQHRTIATYLALLLRASFVLERLEEWGPSVAQVAAQPDWARERERPCFLLIACRRP